MEKRFLVCRLSVFLPEYINLWLDGYNGVRLISARTAWRIVCMFSIKEFMHPVSVFCESEDTNSKIKDPSNAPPLPQKEDFLEKRSNDFDLQENTCAPLRAQMRNVSFFNRP
jgi:hypothetical protein